MGILNMKNMVFIGVFLVWVVSLIDTIACEPIPDYYHHMHHRIHVPVKVKTVYHTKIIKVPEHHHHFHEKEKTYVIEKPKPVPVAVPVPVHHHHKLLEEEKFSDLDHFGGHEHNIFKKHIEPSESPKRKSRKNRKHRSS
ncbi:uncharacterized protein LOC132698317 [Cylas formicarius]|uniref:uncharacterized protein LOC132698317 n=1 Tax=Cylas formicarius TaxID=197179 RepID=UPI0029588995|nr:uncharacterized protein LOC132698317 [Cylas formicarius]